MTYLNALKSAALTAALGLGALTTAPTASNAMAIYNCTNDHLPVGVVHVPSGQHYGTVTLAPGKGATWNTGRGPGFRVGINVIGPDKRFSNRDGGETISIKKIAGNTELISGKQCTQSGQPQQARTQSKPLNFTIGIGEKRRLQPSVQSGAGSSGNARVCFVNQGAARAKLQHGVAGINPLEAGPGGQSCANFQAGSRVNFTLVEQSLGVLWSIASPSDVRFDLSPYDGDVLRLVLTTN